MHLSVSDESGATEMEIVMKKFWLITVGLIALGMAAPASAADMAARPYVKAPPAPVAAIYDWTGFYIGINGGGGSSRKCWDLATDAFGVAVVPPLREGCHDATGATAGGQIGYRWQWGGGWVFGVEGQGNWADFRGDSLSAVIAGDRDRSKIDAFGLLTGQVGYAWNNVLLYVKGGAAVTGDKFERRDAIADTLISSVNETRWGGTVGAGLEFGFASNWSVGIEYDHLFMGTRNITFNTPGGVFDGTDRIRQDVDIGLVRLNYRFGGWGGLGAPVAARY
jgi:outer membrane immunogenic protein